MNKAPSSTPRQSASFWFASNFAPAALAIGFLGPAQGLSFAQSLLAIIPGVLLGSLAPLLLRTSPVYLLALPMAVLLTVLNLQVLNRIALHLLPGTALNWQLLAVLLATLIAWVGPTLLNRVQALLAPVLMVVFGLLTLGAVMQLETDTAQRQLHFSWSAFALQAASAALWQVSLAPVASRGTPNYAAIALPALWLMSLGALMASAIAAVDTVVSLRLLGERFYPGLGTLAVLAGAVAMVSATAVQCQSALSGLGVSRRNEKARVLVLAGLALLVLWINRQVSL